MADTLNNTSNLRANLSEADELFLPKDLDDDGELSEYTGYNVTVFKNLDGRHKSVLVKKNLMTSKWKVSRKKGLNFSLPLFTKRILVPMWEKLKEYNWDNHVCNAEDMAKTTDGITPNIKLSLKVQIINPLTYLKGGKEQFSELRNITDELLNHFISKKSFEQLAQNKVSVEEFDPSGSYEEFEKKTGIKVNGLLFKATLPKDLQDLADKAVKEKLEREAQEERLKAQKEKAEAEAEIKEIEAKAEAKRIKIIESAKAEAWAGQMRMFVQYLEEKGILTENISELLAEQLKLKTVTDSNANAIFSFGDNHSNQAASIAAGINAAYRNNSNPNSKMNVGQTNISNSQQLINDATFYLSQGMLSQERYNMLMEQLQNPEQKKLIDSVSKEIYNNWFLNTVLNQTGTNSQTQSTDGVHHRR